MSSIGSGSSYGGGSFATSFRDDIPLGRGGGGGGGFANDGFGMDGGMGFGGGGDYIVKMRGLPFSATPADVVDFFADVAKVLDVEIEFGRDNRPTGTANVLFGSHSDAKAALSKNRENMGSRYVELFLEGPA